MNTKRSLLTSCMALLLCFAMLLGTTFAWFTDTVTSTGNKIHSGSLKLDLLVLKEGSTDNWFSIKNESKPIFTYENWEPGYTDVTILKVENLGNLSLKWVAKLASENPLSDLAKVIDVYVLPGATEYPTDRTTLDGWNKAGTLDTFINSISTTTYGYLDGGDSATLGIAFKMQEDAGNEYQDLTLGEFDIRIVATQADGEFDDFDNKYDADAQYPADSDTFSASTEVAITDLEHGLLRKPITIGDTDGVNANIPADVKLEEGVTNVKLTVKPADTDSNISLGEGESAVSLDVHIDGIAADNQQPMTVNLGAILPAGLTDTEVKIFHLENGTTVNMTRVDSVADFNQHNQFTYDPETGNVSIYVKSFSVFAAMKRNADKWDGVNTFTSWYYNDRNATEYVIESAECFAGFRYLVDNGITSFEGKTVKLGLDIDLGGYNFDPIGYGYASDGGKVFRGTFDGQHHTIYGLYQNGWDLGYSYGTQGGGLFASVVDATIKNLAISDANIVMECVDMGIVAGYAYGNCNFENIVITNSKIANYNRYTGGVVGEVNGTHTFKNITIDSSVKLSSLWGSFDTSIGGVIGGKYGNATVKMTNVNVAAELDVYSDVTAAYQWYAYRRCGMLIGHTEQNSPKQALNADAPFLTCENVNVYYGDWVNYNYYQFTNQSSETKDVAWQNNYPWVRAEAGEHNGAFSNARYGNPIVGGVAINTLALAQKHCTASTPITFNQLYGGGQGVYGKADHEGVNISYSLPNIYYIENNVDWANLKLHYTYQNSEDTWTTVVDGIQLVEFAGAYRIDLPVGATSFYITADGGQNSKTFYVKDMVQRRVYLLHEHELDANGDCACGYDNLLAGKQFIPTVNADAQVLEANWFTSGRYETLTDGFRKQEYDGRFSTVMNKNTAYVDATINLDGVYTLDTIRFYTYDTRTLTKNYKEALLGANLIVQAYRNGVWTDIINCADNTAISSHLVINNGKNDDYLEFKLSGVAGASAIRILITDAAHDDGITFQEIECTGTQTSATGPSSIPAAPAPVMVNNDDGYVQNILQHKVFIPTAAAKDQVLVADWWKGGDYRALTDGEYGKEMEGRFSTVTNNTTAFVDATVDLECTYKIEKLRLRPYTKDGVVQMDSFGDGLIIDYIDAQGNTVTYEYTYDDLCGKFGTPNRGYIILEPSETVYAQKVRIYIPGAKSTSGITIQEIEIQGVAPENADNVLSGKKFVPSSSAADNIYSGDYGYQTMTDGIVYQEHSGRYSSKQNGGKVEATLDLGSLHILSDFKIYLYKDGIAKFGTGLTVEVLYNGEWKTVVNATTVDELNQNLVKNNGGVGDWLIFDLDDVYASEVRFLIPTQGEGGWTTFYEIECSGYTFE